MSGKIGRQWRATIYDLGKSTGGIVIASPLRAQFKIARDSKASPNTCDLTITNLAPETRAALARPKLVLQLEAGHTDGMRLLFFGDVRHAESTPSGTEWLTKILAGDGARAYRTARMGRSYPPGTDLRRVLRDAAASMGLKLPADLGVAPELATQFADGVAVEGWARDYLTTLLAPYGWRWSSQNGRMVVIRDGQAQQGTAFVLDAANGLIGSPEVATPQPGKTSRTVTARALLYPEIVPGAFVKIDSRTLRTTVRADKVAHTGDSHGSGDDSWTTEIESTLR